MNAGVGRFKLSQLRVLVQILVHVLLVGHVLAYYFLDWRSLGALDFQSFFRHFLGEGLLTAGALLALVIYGTALLFGRLFCSWGCHFGATQDFAAWILKRLGWRAPLLRTRVLHYLPFVFLAMIFLWPVAERWLEKGVRYQGSDLAAVAPWDTLPGWLGTLVAFGACGVGILLFLGTRGFCRFVCPYGAVFRITDRVAPFRVRKVAACGSRCASLEVHPCTAACPTAIDVHLETTTSGQVTSVDCVRCNLCIEACPSQALANVTAAQAVRRQAASVVSLPGSGQSFRLLNLPILASGPVVSPSPATPSRYDLPLWGELAVLVVTLVSYVCFDLVYGGHFVAAAFALAEGFLTYIMVLALRGNGAARVLGWPLRQGRAWTWTGVTVSGLWLLTMVPLFEAGAFKWLRAQGLRLDPGSTSGAPGPPAAMPGLTADERIRLGAAAERYRLAMAYNPRDLETRKLLLSAYARLGDPRLLPAAEELHRRHPGEEAQKLLDWARSRIPTEKVLGQEPPAGVR